MRRLGSSLRPFMNSDNFREISKELKKIEKAFQALDKYGKDNLVEDVNAYSAKFNELFKEILGTKGDIDVMMDDVIEKIVSLYNPTPKDNPPILNYTNPRGKFYQYGQSKIQEVIKQLRPGMGEQIIEEAKTQKNPFSGTRRLHRRNDIDAEVREGKKDVSKNDLFLLDENNEVYITLSNEQENAKLQDEIAMHYKIFPKHNLKTGVKTYSFPLYVSNTHGDMLIVTGKQIGRAHV